MGDNLFQVSLSSMVVSAAYQHLIQMDYTNMEGSSDYLEMVTKIKKYIEVETEAYNKLTDDDIKAYFELVKSNTRFNNVADARVYTRMCEVRRIRDNNPVVNDNILLSSIISSKLTIDILKNINAKIKGLNDNDELDETDIYMLDLYNRRYKYHYLTSNSYIEGIGLDNNFDIDKFPDCTYYDIERKFNVKFIDNVQNNFYSYVIASLDELTKINSDDRYFVIYTSLFELARIEAVIPYLSLDSLNSLSLYINSHITRYDSNSALRKARKMINKKKEEFNK